MYIIDADTHISPTKEGGNSIRAEELIGRMDQAGVDRAVTWIQPPYKRELDAANEYLYRTAREYPDRILGFGWADPNLGVRSAKDMVRKCVYEYGFYGVKLNGAQNSFYIDDEELSFPVIEEIAKTGKLLALHIGADSYQHTHPYRVRKIALRYPELKILMVHMGGAAHDDLSRESIEVAGEFPNITLIGSSVRDVSIYQAIQSLGASRVAFGSDTPFAFMHVEVAKYKALLQGFREEEMQAVMGGNIAALFGL